MNPYSPPQADSAATTAPSKLYSTAQVAAATILGMPLAGAWLLARNYSALGRPELSKRTLAYGALASAVFVGVAFLLPERFPAPVIPVAYIMGLRQLAVQQQGKAIDAHFTAGGGRQSNWRVLGIGVACLVIALMLVLAIAIAMGLMALRSQGLPDLITQAGTAFGGGELLG